MRRRLLYLVLPLVLTAGASNASAQPPASAPAERPWDTLVVPGGFAALQHAAQLSGPIEDWRTIPLVIELSFARLDGLRNSRNVAAYGALLRRVNRQATEISPDRTVSIADRQNRRAAVDELLEILGLEYDPRARAVRSRADTLNGETSGLLEKAGLPRAVLVTRLNAGERVPIVTVDSTAPLPLGRAFWEERFEPVPPPHDLLFAILASREMASLYYGLLSLDDETLRAVQADQKLARTLVQHALVLPTVADALRIERNRVVSPGGSDAAGAWQDLIGEPLDRPAAFIEDLLRKDDGRLALFYRTVSDLPQETVRWMLGPPSQRARSGDILRRVHERFSGALRDWRADAFIQPPTFGPSEVLSAISIRGDGTWVGPAARGFWQKLFESSDWPSEAETAALDPEALDAADLLELVCPSGCDREKLGAVTLIQQEFPGSAPQLMPRLIPVGRCRLRYPALALEIERMRLADAAPYAALGSLAARIETLDDPVRAVSLVQYQSAVALLSRLRAVGSPAVFVAEHLHKLSALRITEDGFEGGLVRWALHLFRTGEGESLDDAATRMLAGEAWQAAGAVFDWEGVAYRVDIPASEKARIREALGKFTANTLEQAATFLRLSDEMPNRVAAGEVAGFIDALRHAVTAARDVTSASWTGSPVEFERFSELSRLDLLQRDGSPDERRVERSVRSLRAAADLAGADALVSLVYALALRNTEGALAMNPELPRRHHLVPQGPSGHRSNEWAVPAERFPDVGTRYISGALLALDGGVPLLSARRLAAERPSTEPTMAPALATALLRTAALAAPWTIRSEDLAAIHEAHARGSAILEKWSSNGHGEDHVTEAGLVGPRTGWLRWAARRGDRPRHIDDLTGTVMLGGLQPAARSSWGAAQSRATCLCHAIPGSAWLRRTPHDPEAVAATFLEASIRTALELQLRRAPAAVAPGVLMLVMNDVIDSALLPHPVDASVLTAAVRQIPSVRFDDYIAAVAARGPLVRTGADAKGDR